MKKILVFGCFIFFVTAAFSQNHITVTGQVKEKSAGPIEAVKITLYDTSGIAIQKAVTDKRGIYVVTVPAGNYHLVAVCPGYIAEEQPILLTEQKTSMKVQEMLLRRYKRKS